MARAAAAGATQAPVLLPAPQPSVRRDVNSDGVHLVPLHESDEATLGARDAVQGCYTSPSASVAIVVVLHLVVAALGPSRAAGGARGAQSRSGWGEREGRDQDVFDAYDAETHQLRGAPRVVRRDERGRGVYLL
jgi:hypothetical protein